MLKHKGVKKMSLILDEQFLSGFVTQSELDAYTGRLAARGSACTPRTDAQGLAHPPV